MFVGDISYGIYLWHWPLIVLWKDQSGGGIGRLGGPAIIVATVVLAWLTKVCVEDPVRRAPVISRRTWRSLAVATCVLVPVGLVAFYAFPPPYQARLDSRHPGAAVLAGDVAALPKAPLIPPLLRAATDQPPYGGCEAGLSRTSSKSCLLGDTTDPKLTVALVGDSVAAQWFGSMVAIATERHWKLVTYLRQLCPWTSAMTVTPHTAKPYTTCNQWGRSATAAMLALHPDVIIYSAEPVVGTTHYSKGSPESMTEIANGMAPAWRQLARTGTRFIGIKESPEMGHDVPDCLSTPRRSAASCSTPANQAVLQHTPVEQAVALLGGAAELVDLNALICQPQTCPPVVGNIAIYRDEHHLTYTYTMSLTPYLERDLLATKALAGR